MIRRIALLLGLLALPLSASAHAFGQQYTLPLPLTFYVIGASLALVASFVILSIFSTPGGEAHALERTYVLPPWLLSPAIATGLRSFGVFVLLTTLVTGFLGSSDVTKNPALFLFWIGLLLLLVYASAVVSGIWTYLNPFRTLTEFVLGRAYVPVIKTPPGWLRYVPAILFYYFLLWLELLSYGAGAVPSNVALVLIGYLFITFFGVGLFGNEAWFRWGDFFSVLFDAIRRFAPFSFSGDTLRVTLPGERLVAEKAESPGLLIFILLILSSTAYDGLHDTRPWVSFFAHHQLLTDYYALVSFVLLVVSPFIFFGLYALAVYFMRRIAGYGSYRSLLLRFAFSLIPIALAYNVAHYFSLAISEGQNFIPMLSDPLGRGSDIFGTAHYAYNPALIGAGAVWYVQVAAIVLGHIIAAYVAHRIALREFSTRTQVIFGQLPMLVLMVLYTSFGLWILSLPYGT